MRLLSSADFFQIELFQKLFQEYNQSVKKYPRNKENLSFLRTSDGGNGNHSVWMPIILILINLNDIPQPKM